VVRIHGHGLQQFLHEDAALLVGGLTPQSVDVQLSEDAGDLLELGGDL